MLNSIILHIPHSSDHIPPEFIGSFITAPGDQIRFMTDWFTDELFDVPGQRIVFPISRLICDVERFRDDGMEEMSRRGMGVCYTRGCDGKILRRFGDEEKERILERWYDTHHAELTRKVARCIDRFGECTVVDCHSFSATPLPYEPDQDPYRPDVCIGTDVSIRYLTR